VLRGRFNCGMSKAKASNGYLGVTEPISLSGPTDKDLVQTAEVEKVGHLRTR
jgi:hypothetical protein